MVSIRRLILSYTMQPVIPNICTKFQNPMCSCFWEIFDTNFPIYYIRVRDENKQPKGQRSLTWVQCINVNLATLCNLSPTPMMLHIKFDQDWQSGFRDIQVQKCEIFVIQEQVTPKWVVWFGPKSNSTKLLCLSWLPATLMMIRSKMNELAWRHYSPIISIWEIF